jgi:8-oxo-dGTP pyrophosphatase MutT (NUDIX family)
MVSELDLEEIRRKLSKPPEVDRIGGDHAFDPDWLPNGQTFRDAAVLVPLLDRAEGPTVLLTLRAEHLSSHAGQVSFPGGRVEPQDASAIDAALRETEEEVGLDRAFVTIWGTLDPYLTGTGFSILPVVGHVREGFELTIDQQEVAEAFEVPLEFLMNPANHARHSAHWQGKERTYYAMPYGDYYIWGATAGMLVNLYHRLYGRNG